MWQYIVRRIFISVMILFGISILLYILIRSMPGDYITMMTTGKNNVTPAMVEHLRHLYGLDTNIPQGYFNWISRAIQGDFGVSFFYQRPVADIIGEKVLVSFTLALPVFILTILIGVPLGIISATRPYSKLDYAITTIAFVGISVPSFFLAVVLKRVFAYGLKWFPPFGMVTATEDYTGFALFMDKSWHLVLPIVCLTFIGIGSYMRYARSNMLEVLDTDYIRTARAKGLPEGTVIYSHAFRNTLIPIVTIIGGSIPGLFAGAMITENLFQIPGIGWYGYQSLTNGDIPFVMAFNLFVAALTLLGNLLADISYALVDPRIRLK
ncbi:peptide ABC transporter permease [Clostridia bacterium]|nr:peptide ABC transporter permease [Clostridia bacterium]